MLDPTKYFSAVHGFDLQVLRSPKIMYFLNNDLRHSDGQCLYSCSTIYMLCLLLPPVTDGCTY